MKQASGMSDRTSQIILTAICAVVLIIVAYPLYYVVVASFSDPYEVYAGKTFLFPSGFTLDGYKSVFLNDGIVSGFLNSVKYTVIGTIFSVVMLYITAYPLAQRDLPGRKALSIFFLFTMYFGGGLVPTYLVVKQTGLVGSMWSLIWTRPQKLWSGVADNTLRNRRKVSFLRRDCLTLTCVLTNAPKYDNLTQVSKTPKEGPV